MTEAAIARGHDGMVVLQEGERVIVAVFDPAQIKSVFNTGTYDALNPDIRFARSATSVMETSDA
jgi:hypothetical protein